MTAWKAGQAELRDTVRACAADRQMTARMLAAELDIKTEVVHALMGGYRQWWLEAVEIMADLFEMSVDELVGDGITPLPKAQIKRGRQAAPVPESRVLPGKVRALCCICGTMTRVKRADVKRDDGGRRPGTVEPGVGAKWWHDNRLAGRYLWLTDCVTCEDRTRHALLADHRSPDWHERVEQAQSPRPSADDLARRDLDALVRRMEGFGVDIHWRLIRSRRAAKKGQTQPALAVEFDESKDRWRVEISTGYPAVIQLPLVTEAWEVIALDKKEWWADFEGKPTEGAWMYPRTDDFDAAFDGLIDEIHNAAPAVLTSIVLDAATDRQADR